ncbi:MAG: hypothetical protein Q7T11_03550 [Deltaproteobacteria bacterium]|nr:hypothetical protein [Deltaproteobacteria bacterium]
MSSKFVHFSRSPEGNCRFEPSPLKKEPPKKFFQSNSFKMAHNDPTQIVRQSFQNVEKSVTSVTDDDSIDFLNHYFG